MCCCWHGTDCLQNDTSFLKMLEFPFPQIHIIFPKVTLLSFSPSLFFLGFLSTLVPKQDLGPAAYSTAGLKASHLPVLHLGFHVCKNRGRGDEKGSQEAASDSAKSGHGPRAPGVEFVPHLARCATADLLLIFCVTQFPLSVGLLVSVWHLDSA